MIVRVVLDRICRIQVLTRAALKSGHAGSPARGAHRREAFCRRTMLQASLHGNATLQADPIESS